MEDNVFSRRGFIQRYLFGSVALVSGVVVFGCNSLLRKKTPEEVTQETNSDTTTINKDSINKDISASEENCDNLTGIDPEEIEKRKRLAYVNSSPIPDSNCANCALHIPAKPGKSCGGCVLFKGPVSGEGYCAYWAPINN